MKTIIGIMGPGESAGKEICAFAEATGAALAKAGFVVLSGGREEGVMQAAMKGAAKAGGLTVGILPGSDKKGMSEYVEIPVFTESVTHGMLLTCFRRKWLLLSD